MKLREYNTQKKRESRERLSNQKKRRVKEYDRNRKVTNTMKVAATMEKKCSAPEKPFSPSAHRMASSGARGKMPKSPSKYAKVMLGLLKYASPKKKEAMKKIGIANLRPPVKVSEDVKKRLLSSLKNSKGRAVRRTYCKLLLNSYSTITRASKELGVRWHYLNKISKLSFEELREEKPRRGLSDEVVQQVHDFYEAPMISISLGGMKNVNRKGESVKYLTEKISTVYKKFVQKSGCKVSKSKFAKLRPQYVKLKCNISQNQCVCNTCTNIELIVKGLTEAGVGSLGDKETLCASTMVQFNTAV